MAASKTKTEKMKIDPYKSIDGYKFGQTIEEAEATFGPPMKMDDRDGQVEMHYPFFILRFDEHSKLFKEFTALPECPLILHDHTVAWDKSFLKYLYESDNGMVTMYGFVVSFRNGISLSGFHDDDESHKAIHVFGEGVWEVEPDDVVTPFTMN